MTFVIYTFEKVSHGQIGGFIKGVIENGLKISPKKCQLFRTNLQYMGNEIFIQNKRVCVQPLRGRLEAIQKSQPSTTVKGCSSFVGKVNFLSMFCTELQKLLKPIYNLTRKGGLFIWGKEQDSFDKIKCRLTNPQFCICPKNRQISLIFGY